MTQSQSRRGRKPVHIDLEELEKLSALHCTDEEIAGWFKVSTRTIEKRRKRPAFAAVMESGRARGRVSVRRAQMQMLLEAGSTTMAVWLGKQILGQRDVITNEHSGPGGAPIQVVLAKPDLSLLSDQDLTSLQGMVQKLAGEPEESSSPSPAQDAGQPEKSSSQSPAQDAGEPEDSSTQSPAQDAGTTSQEKPQ